MKYLVFSENYPDGAQLTFDDYTKLLKSMTSEDFETHYKVDVVESMTELVEATLDALSSSPRSRN
jgi:hypothetical protein